MPKEQFFKDEPLQFDWDDGADPEENLRRQKVWSIEHQIASYRGRMRNAKSMERKARYGKKIRMLKGQLTYLKIANA